MHQIFMVLGLSLLYGCDISHGKQWPLEELNRHIRQSNVQFNFPQQFPLGPIVPALPQQSQQTNIRFPPPPLPPLPPFFPPINFPFLIPANNVNSAPTPDTNLNRPLAFLPQGFQPPNKQTTIKPFFQFPGFLFPFPIPFPTIKTASTTTKTTLLTTSPTIHTTTTTTPTTPITSTTPILSTTVLTTLSTAPSTTLSTTPSTTLSTTPSTTLSTTPSTTLSTTPSTTPSTTLLNTPTNRITTSPVTSSLSTTILITTLAPISTTCKPRIIQPTESPPTIQCTGDGCKYSLTFERNRKVIVDNHNKRRREITDASNMYEMIWDTEAANIAQKQADSCSKEKPSTAKSSKFECNFNTYANESGSPWARVIAMWAQEKSSFTYGQESAGTEKFTQIIWANSYLIGCGYTKCNNEYTYVCAYCPGGNIPGKSGEPYKKGIPCEVCPCGECHNGLCLPPE